MCTPQTKPRIRRSSMISEVPVNFSSSVVVKDGDEGYSRTEATSTKPCIVKDMIKTLTVLGSMFAVFLLKGNASLFRFNTPSRISLVHQIDELKHDLESYETLKKTYVDDAVQLSWDKQHIIESERVVNSMMNSSIELSQHFYDEEQKLIQENEQAHQLVAELSKHAADAVQLDHEAMLKISREVEESYSEAQNEHRQNVALRRQIAETMQELKRRNIEVPEHILQSLFAQHLV
ncbi:hypothetical protein HJC23_004371 [Cyclotella cryptica]|uniref:Uncharacterized protein n=1 Tax=Cyclotella cryptica TaxID=29204 RepID=A0ABD3PHY2_9STRA